MVCMEAWPTSTSLRSMEQGRLATYVYPAAVSIRPRSAQARVLGLGAERAAARGYVIPDDSGSEEERAAGGAGPQPPIERARSAGWRRYNDTWPQILSGRGVLTHWDGGGRTIHAMDIEGVRRRSVSQTWGAKARARHRLESGSPSRRGRVPGLGRRTQVQVVDGSGPTEKYR